MPTPTIKVAPASMNFEVRKGSTLRRTITWYSEPVFLDTRKTKLDLEKSVPLDLTGYTGRMQIRSESDNTQLFELTTENGGLTFGGTTGTITFFLSDLDTDDPASDACVHDMEVMDLIGDVIPLIAGTFVFKDQITV